MTDIRGLCRSAIAAVLLLLLLASTQMTLFGSKVQDTDANSIGPDCWTQYPSPIKETTPHYLGDVYAISANDIWAVGTGNYRKTLTMHWDGTQWRVVPSPNVDEVSVLTSVSGLSPNDVWAVGFTIAGGYTFPNEYRNALTMHWDGLRWSIVPNPGGGSLNSVASIARNDVWAVGDTGRGQVGGQPVIMHWNGSSWSSIDSERLAPASYLNEVFALSSTNVWVVGTSILHWDGTRWSVVSQEVGDLCSMAATTSNDVWAVGTPVGSRNAIVHWDGARWSNVQSPLTGVYRLVGVAALSPNDAWAVSDAGQALHWDGKVWTIASGVPGSTLHRFSSITTAASDVWIAGYEATSPTDSSAKSGLLWRNNAPCAPDTRTKPLNPPVPLPGAGSRYFPQTGKTVTGVFLQYWNAHGGLPQQGYPISDVIGEVSDLNGQLYTMQYFERAVFEYHPENQPPYNVLLSQLGTLRYKKEYPRGALGQMPNGGPGSVLFKETGKRLGGRFVEYWRENGGPMQQGYPISEEFMDISPLDRRLYTTQYFERAAFEYHPENKPPYDVLLSHLGRFRWEEKYGTSPYAPSQRR